MHLTEECHQAKTQEERQRLFAESLEAAARLNPFQDISDPVAWQREIRLDRPLLDQEGKSSRLTPT
ncbi:MAG: hypothetical protein H7839_11735 [Magnetococcus sp. YQC-5]